jgi:hypothetical protein
MNTQLTPAPISQGTAGMTPVCFAATHFNPGFG